MTRVKVQAFEEDGTTGEVWIRDTASPDGGAYGAVAGGGAPTGAQYVTLATNGSLTHERVLTAGTGVTITDAGAGSTVTVAADTLDTIPAPVAAVGFSQQQATQFRIENRTSDPGTPAVGEIWLRTDL
jgi:hypothetical protein